MTFVTSNHYKVENAQEALSPYGITVKQHPLEIPESRSEIPKQIALEKAQFAYKRLKKPLIVEDSGFFIKALGGFPMTHIRFSLKTLGIKKILKMLSGEKDRSAEWQMTVVYVFGPKRYKTFTFIEKGTIANQMGSVQCPIMSDYWRIYIPRMIPDNTKALSEMTDTDLAKWKDYYAKNNHFKKFGTWAEKDFSKTL